MKHGYCEWPLPFGRGKAVVDVIQQFKDLIEENELLKRENEYLTDNNEQMFIALKKIADDGHLRATDYDCEFFDGGCGGCDKCDCHMRFIPEWINPKKLSEE